MAELLKSLSCSLAVLVVSGTASASYVANDPLNATDPEGQETYYFNKLDDAKKRAVDAALSNKGLTEGHSSELSSEVNASLSANDARIDLARGRNEGATLTSSGAVNQRGAIPKFLNSGEGEFVEGTADGHSVEPGITFTNPSRGGMGTGTTGVGILSGSTVVVTNVVDFNNVSKETRHSGGGAFLEGTARGAAPSLQSQANQIGAPSLTVFQSSMRQGDRAALRNVPPPPVFVVTTPQ